MLLFFTTYFGFNEVSLKSDVKLAAIIFNLRVILKKANGTTLEYTFYVMEFSQRLFRIKISLSIYCVRSVAKAFCESLYLYNLTGVHLTFTTL